MLLELPQVHYNTFIFILAFLRELLENVEHNELSAESLGESIIRIFFIPFFLTHVPSACVCEGANACTYAAGRCN